MKNKLRLTMKQLTRYLVLQNEGTDGGTDVRTDYEPSPDMLITVDGEEIVLVLRSRFNTKEVNWMIIFSGGDDDFLEVSPSERLTFSFFKRPEPIDVTTLVQREE